MRGLSQAVQPQDGPEATHVPAHWGETLQLRGLWQGIHPGGPDGEARRHPQEETPAHRHELTTSVADAAADEHLYTAGIVSVGGGSR